MTQRPNMIDPALIPNKRFKVHKIDEKTYIVVDSTTGGEFAVVREYETANGQRSNDAFNRALDIAFLIEPWDYRPLFSA